MNPWHLSTSELLIWGVVLHLIADWPLQNDWMAKGKVSPWRWSVVGLAPAFTHGFIHMVLLCLVFGWWPAYVLGLVHIAIDTRLPVVWWSRLVRQTQPEGGPQGWLVVDHRDGNEVRAVGEGGERRALIRVVRPMLVDVGTEVRFWTDQVFHIACIAAAALAVGGLS